MSIHQARNSRDSRYDSLLRQSIRKRLAILRVFSRGKESISVACKICFDGVTKQVHSTPF